MKKHSVVVQQFPRKTSKTIDTIDHVLSFIYSLYVHFFAILSSWYILGGLDFIFTASLKVNIHVHHATFVKQSSWDQNQYLNPKETKVPFKFGTWEEA